MAGDVEVTLHYWGGPVISPNIDKMLGVSSKLNDTVVEANVVSEVPQGWEVETVAEAMGQKCFILRALKVEDHNIVGVCITLPDGQRRTKFVILGLGEARGYPSGKNVPTCPRCHAWIDFCICGKEER